MTKRKDFKHPYLNKSANTKSRRDVMDNIYYVDGIKNKKGEEVIRPLTEEEKDWLNKFNAEYYGADFDSDYENNLHQDLASPEVIAELKSKLKEARLLCNKLYHKINYGNKKKLVSETELENKYTEALKVKNDIEDTLEVLQVKKSCSDANNSRNRDLMTVGKIHNILVSWDTLNANTVSPSDIEIDYELIAKKKSK